MSDPQWVSARAVAWVIHDAPVPADLFATLTIVAARCDEHGRGSRQSYGTIAELAGKSVAQVKRDVKRLRDLGLLLLGDQSLADGFPSGRRPVVYDVPLHVSGPKPVKESRNGSGAKKAPPLDGTPPIQGGGSTDATGGTHATLTGCMGATGSTDATPTGSTHATLTGSTHAPQTTLRTTLKNNPLKPAASFAGAPDPAPTGQRPEPSPAEPPTQPPPKKPTRKTRSPEQRARFDTAHRLAGDWWTRCDTQNIPNIRRGNSSAFPGFRSMLERALAADCTETEIKWALADLADPFPSAARFQQAIARRRGVAPPASGRPVGNRHLQAVTDDAEQAAQQQERRELFG